jgi:hypothetical protein
MGKKWRRLKTQMSRQLDPLRRRRGHQILHLLGDSHLSMFENWHGPQALPRTVIRPTKVPGATALGLANPNSKSNALAKFEAQLGHITAEDFTLFLLGEVDCGFVIWYRAAKMGLSVESQLEESLSNYRNFVRDSGLPPEKTIICCAPLPTIGDEQNWGEVANARREITATIQQRTDLTRAYNQQLRAWCDAENRRFLDFESEITDPQTGLVAAQFLHPDPLDHHLNPTQIQPILRQKLVQVLNRE